MNSCQQKLIKCLRNLDRPIWENLLHSVSNNLRAEMYYQTEELTHEFQQEMVKQFKSTTP